MINRVSVEASFFKKLSAMENLLYAARLYGVDAKYARREVIRILGGLGIPRDTSRSRWSRCRAGCSRRSPSRAPC